jgi:hypothetical protein
MKRTYESGAQKRKRLKIREVELKKTAKLFTTFYFNKKSRRVSK